MACKICEGWKIFCDELKEENRKICLTLDAVRLENERLKGTVRELTCEVGILLDKVEVLRGEAITFDRLPF